MSPAAKRSTPRPRTSTPAASCIALPEGIKGILLPKKTRGESVNLRLVLHYGDLDSLKGYEAAAEMLPGLMTARHEEPDAATDSG